MIREMYLKLEKKFLQWVLKKRILILIYLGTLLLIYVCYYVPYLNIFMSISLTLFLAVVSAILIFRISVGKIFILSILLFLVALPLVLLKEYAKAEEIINLVYMMIFVSFIPYIFELKNEK